MFMESYYLQEVLRKVSMSVRKEFYSRSIAEGPVTLLDDPEVGILKV